MSDVPYLKAWFVFFLSASVIGFIGGAIIGFFIGFGSAVAGLDVGFIRIASGIGGFIVSMPVSYLCYRFTVKKFIVDKLRTTDTVPQTFS